MDKFAVAGERRKKQLWLGRTVEQRLEMYRASKPVLPSKTERDDFQ